MGLSRLYLSLLALLATAMGDVLPYNPTSIFVSPNNAYAYVFQPSSGNQASLSTIHFSKSLDVSSYDSTTLFSTLPFLRNREPQPYTSAIDKSGNITVLTGDCADGASGAEIWQFVPNLDDKQGNGTWYQYKTSAQDLDSATARAGATYLSSSVLFSETADGDATKTNLYVFAGMCPYDNGTEGSWTSASSYSNLMQVYSPTGLNSNSAVYDINTVADRGPPIPQAGASLTPLPATYGTDANGAATTQQQDFVLLGGNTETAFINMSQLALFSLPQQSWTFMTVQQPPQAKTDLARRINPQSVTPRSGHSAVLSEDGNSIIMFGGWVGDVNTPAEPQLAILDLGSGFGGNGEWAWNVPRGKLPYAGAGLYGHGAAMLPGGVMMILGGYEISTPSSKLFRRGSQTANDKTYLYNITSNTWISSYSPPPNISQQSGNDSSDINTKSERVGLGAGLGVGAALLVTVTGFYFWYSKRMKGPQEDRERTLLTMSSDGSSVGQIDHIDQAYLGDGGFDGRGGTRYWSNEIPTGEYPRPPEMQHTTGMFVNVPSPTRGLRRNISGKSYHYHAAPRFDDSRLSRGSGNIHTITENVEEEESQRNSREEEVDGLTDAEKKLREVERVLNSHDPLDPFKDDPEPNPLGSHPVSPMARDANGQPFPSATFPIRLVPQRKPLPTRDPGSENWTVVTAQEDQQPSENEKRLSFIRDDDRTSSNLSERSHTSTNSIARTMSTRTGAMLAAAAAATSINRTSIGQPGSGSPTDERSHTMSTTSGRKSPFLFISRTRSSTNSSVQPAGPASVDNDSFSVARSNFTQLQSEGEALLGGCPTIDPDDPYQRALAAHTSSRPKSEGPPASATALVSGTNRRRPGWMGSLRRALNVVAMGERSFSLTGAQTWFAEESNTAASSPLKDSHNPLGTKPRRAISDGGTLLRQKRGQKDWEDKVRERFRDDPDTGDWGEPRPSSDQRQAEEDWDVEGAASKRDFQVMFSVPKARLRVVNDDMDRASLRSASDSALSRASSLKNLRHEESIKALRAKVEADILLLPTTEEEKEDSDKEKAA